MNTKEAAADIGCSESYLDKAAVARRRAQEENRSDADLTKIGPAFRWIGSRREYDQPDLDAYKRETRVEPRRAAAIQQEA
jgi:hypothetical protein